MNTRALHTRLVRARFAASLTQAELAREFGVSERTMGAWESGRVIPRPRHRRLIMAFVERHEEEAA